MSPSLAPVATGLESSPPPGYYEHQRPEVRALVPAAARRILDIGCAGGRLGAALKADGGREVVGIEIDPEAAHRARAHLDRVLIGDVERMPLPFPPEAFDCIICADVLEHLRDPWAVLGRLRRLLGPAGTLVASFPNVRHIDILRDLVRGRWTYRTAGILDRTHLRFFTRREFERMLRAAGFTGERWTPRIPEQFAPLSALPTNRRMDVTTPEFRIPNLPVRAVLEFLTVQFLVVARPGPAAAAMDEADDEPAYTLEITPSSTSQEARGKRQESSQ